jgi:hypothetical protein
MLEPQKIQAYLDQVSRPNLPVVDFLKRNIFMYGMWLMGIPVFLYGAAERGWAAYNGQFAEVTLLSHCMIALMALLGWFIIGMAVNTAEPITWQSRSPQSLTPLQTNAPVPLSCVAEQQYRLPFSHQCQIYHLLNLKHLEEIHRFSLGNLKVTEVSDFQETQTGGTLRFKTVLDSPTNVLRMWRDPSVEVELILHTPYQIELKVPAYNEKHIHVLFEVLPLTAKEHQLSIKMFSDLGWPHTVMRAILIIAASLTLLEDLPYLNRLSSVNLGRSRQPDRDTLKTPNMQLFRRYLRLYGHHWDSAKLLPASTPI